MRFDPTQRNTITTVILFLAYLAAPVSIGQTVVTLTTNLNASGGVSVDTSGDIYVADFGIFLNNANGTNVYKVLRDGSFSVFATGLRGASGNDFDSQGNLFQSNIAVGDVSKIDTAGNVSFFASANLFAPVGIAIAAGDTVFVAECGAGWIVRITPNGVSSIFTPSSLLNCPNGLTMDDDGNLYTCNFDNGWVVKITPDGTASNFAEIPGGRNGHLTFANGRLYVVGRCANQIFEVELDGTVNLLAGTGARGNDDGPALQATFNLSNGIAASPDGDTLYINDAVSLHGDCVTTPLNPVIVRMIVGVLSSTGVTEADGWAPELFELKQNYPNPFNPKTTIRFTIPTAQEVSLKVLDVLGREVTKLVNEWKPAGIYDVDFDAADVTSGVYYYRLQAGTYFETRKMLLINEARFASSK